MAMIYLCILRMGEGAGERGRRVRERKEKTSNQPTNQAKSSSTARDERMEAAATRGRHSRATTHPETNTHAWGGWGSGGARWR